MARAAAVTKERSVSAEFEKVLWYADGPQVVLLRVAPSFVLGVCIDQVSDKAQFLGSRISPGLLETYLRNRCDLRYALAYPDRGKHYLFDLSDENSKVSLRTFDFDIEVHECLLPEHRLFASDHTEDYNPDGASFNFVQRYLVDGKWEVAEFSKFHRNLSDLYALGRSLESFESDQVAIDDKRRIMDSFIQPWRGGGSYVTFFNEITKSGGRKNRPIVDAIQWASPGHMDILGDKASFQRVSKLLEHYDANREKIGEAYDRLWRYLSERSLLRTGRKSFDRKSVQAQTINGYAKSFSKVLGMSSYRTLKKMSGNDPLIASKVLLASARRLAKTHKFFLEGRIAMEDREIG